MMHAREKSDSAIVAGKPTNKAERSAAEPVEPRAETKGNANQQSTHRTQSRASVTQALERVRKAASKRKKEKFTALFHHISVEHLEAAFFELQENAAAGVDGLTWRAYQADLERNLEDLHGRLHRGAYRPLPSRRVYIPKPDGRRRRLAVAALEDKIVQRAAMAVLNAIYEGDFLGFSYGFRPGRGAHDAMDALVVGIESRKVNFILDADIRSFFDTVDQEWLIGFEYESDAQRFLDAMRERLGKFALSLHPEKTRLIEFGRFAAKSRERRGLGKPETFNFLGFTFICSKSRRGKFQIKRKSRRDRMRAKLQAIKQELRRRIHQPIPVQGKWLRQVVTGYFNYHAVPTNGPALAAFRFFVTELWQRTLRRRSQKDGMTWERITRLANDWLPKPHILHPWPQARFAVTHPRSEPYAGIPLVRICAG